MRSLFSGPIRRSFRDIPTLETPRLVLRKILPQDLEDMYDYSRDPETSKYLLWEPHTSREYTRTHIRYLQKEYQSASFFDWALIHKETGKMIGTCGFTEIYERKRCAEVGYVLSPRFHRMGLAPEALQRIMDYGFKVLGLKKLSGRFMEDNLASRKVLERLGYQEDTVKREYFYKRGKKQQILTYSITDKEYQSNLNQRRTFSE
ncbi:MAG: GNAT family N-acetyltransferase [Clostridia bacterium]|nr:GNAT family N-acetyltransferase [Clostridia bacterium]